MWAIAWIPHTRLESLWKISIIHFHYSNYYLFLQNKFHIKIAIGAMFKKYDNSLKWSQAAIIDTLKPCRDEGCALGNFSLGGPEDVLYHVF